MDLTGGSPAETVPRTGPAAGTVTAAKSRRPDEPGSPGPALGEPRRRVGRGFAWRPWHLVPVLVAVVIVTGAVSAPVAFPAGLRVPVGRAVEDAFNAFAESGTWLYEPIATVLDGSFDWFAAWLQVISPPVLVAAVVLLVGYFKGVRLGLLAAVTFAWVVLTGLWEPTVETVAFMLVAVIVSAVVGVGLGLAAAAHPRAHAAVRMLLDAVQAFPGFAYLVPVVFLFGMGNTPALIVTVIWAMPPIARMTSVGLRDVSPDVLEAAAASGASRRQLLLGVRIPMAAPSIRAGLNQTIMYTIAMATMAAMIGAAGLGAPVWSALRRLEFGEALQAGIALVLVAILMDRASSPRSGSGTTKRTEASDGPHPRPVGRFLRKPSLAGTITFSVFLAVVVASQLFRGSWQNFAEPPWGTPVRLREPVGDAVIWVTTTWGPGLDAVGSAIQQFGLNRLGDFFASIPWPVVALCSAVLGVVVAGKVKGVFIGLGVVAIGCLGMWEPTAETLAVVSTAIALSVLIGFPVGVLMSASDAVAAVMRPILDVMQTLPGYLLIIPAVMIFGSGEVAAVLATVLAAVPPVIRFTNTALRGADPEVVEAAVTFGATPGQVLRQVRIPLGLQTIMVGLNQAVLLALAMAVISAMIGAPGLGQDILASVERVDLARGVEAGLAMFLLGVIIDRLFDGSARMLTTLTHTSASPGKAGS
ncbi:ABC transporter permease [Streptomyces sp. SP18BB07]|uniref:ABC transporter permease n=1 Tax=Streptomyces sp. SP18BB07 TaxID=3002522 RepID=UPI002E7878C3|nr:ABC transporter permease subunit [Streptomyces sp. SP18BB07]MEE1757678.1 ABC transporter permease subunit [Streptomyces sp. SP18BB07]